MQKNYIDKLNEIVKMATVDEKDAKHFKLVLEAAFMIMSKLKNDSKEKLINDMANASFSFTYKETDKMKRESFTSEAWYLVYSDAYAIVEGFQLAIASYKHNNIIDFMMAMRVVKSQIELLQESWRDCLKTDNVEEA